MRPISELIDESKKLISSGNFEAAQHSCEQILRLNAAEPSALRALLQVHVQAKQFARALFYCESLLQLQPADIGLHQMLADCLQKVCEEDPSGQTLATLLEQLPAAYSSRLLYGRQLELKSAMFAAGREYLIALKTANARGFWLNAASTAPWCRNFVSYAMGFIEKYRINLSHQWLEPLWQRYGRAELARISKAIQMYTGERALEFADPRQTPNFLYIPDLPIAPVFDRAVLPFAERYESQAAVIKTELKQLLSDNNDFRPFQEGEAGEGLTQGGAWDAYFFYRHGQTYTEHLQKCPGTAAALAELPLVHVADHAPEVCFSLMRPAAHILPHRGVTNSRAVLHLALDIPPECRLHLPGITELSWQEGKTFAFDDTYLHEAWNRSDKTRAVILSDIWNPYLRQEEQLALTELIVQIGLFNKQTAAVPL
ncbi:aspartyl/asparaginyl beta-hydroxylase domain-containing protein [Rheinheimera soli]|uniref:Aspartate beta-hydroxylase n=1 Tax=Rheinheimera soli TaxID=443616 RepID=A0ABU1W3S6_9GAMM|nr:aspartyl/asparaginyl beta-hydroxylase domain-containing protein [Rheinheimera soli]MDR7122611.1 aspartate beta-hydroxylase [Rheinheimera soli]